MTCLELSMDHENVIPAQPGIQRLAHQFCSKNRKPREHRLHRNNGKHKSFVAAAFACAILLMVSIPTPSFAQASTDTAPPRFNDRSEEQRFRTLVSELRCVMCQNQSLADSNALIAYDLRREVLALIRQGKSDVEIKQFLVARYGEFVLYQPRVGSKTWLLWFGPALLLLAGAGVIARIVRKRGGRAVPSDDAQEW